MARILLALLAFTASAQEESPASPVSPIREPPEELTGDALVEFTRNEYLEALAKEGIQATRGCWLYGDYRNDIPNVNDPVNCAQACNLDENCYHWNFKFMVKRCDLKAPNGGINQDIGDWITGHASRLSRVPIEISFAMVADSRPLLDEPTSSRGRKTGYGTVAVGLLLMCGMAILSEPRRLAPPRESRATEATMLAAQGSQGSGPGSWADWWNSLKEVASDKMDEAEKSQKAKMAEDWLDKKAEQVEKTNWSQVSKNVSQKARLAEDWLDKKAAQVEKTNWSQVSKNVSQKARLAEDWLDKKAEQVEKTNWSQVSKNVSQKAKIAEDWLDKKAEQVEKTNWSQVSKNVSQKAKIAEDWLDKKAMQVQKTNWSQVQGTMSNDTQRLSHHFEALTIDETERLRANISTYKARVRHPRDGDIEIDWSCADKVLVGAGLIAGATQITVFNLVPAFFRILGFAAEGVTADSLAAKWQSSIGNVEKSSLFAILQSIAMAGISSESYVLVVAATEGTGITSAVPILEKVCNPQEIHVIGSGDPVGNVRPFFYAVVLGPDDLVLPWNQVTACDSLAVSHQYRESKVSEVPAKEDPVLRDAEQEAYRIRSGFLADPAVSKLRTQPHAPSQPSKRREHSTSTALPSRGNEGLQDDSLVTLSSESVERHRFLSRNAISAAVAEHGEGQEQPRWKLPKGPLPKLVDVRKTGPGDAEAAKRAEKGHKASVSAAMVQAARMQPKRLRTPSKTAAEKPLSQAESRASLTEAKAVHFNQDPVEQSQDYEILSGERSSESPARSSRSGRSSRGARILDIGVCWSVARLYIHTSQAHPVQSIWIAEYGAQDEALPAPWERHFDPATGCATLFEWEAYYVDTDTQGFFEEQKVQVWERLKVDTQFLFDLEGGRLVGNGARLMQCEVPQVICGYEE
ncbi:Dnah12 [Symbiodinium microadriaticum]|nr:Dnah12 [Symbiodinium microadriaticum]